MSSAPWTPWRMAIVHFARQKYLSLILVVSMALALASAGLIQKMNDLNSKRYDSIPKSVQAVVGPKSGGIDILLGSLHGEDWGDGVLPRHLFDTIRAGADIRFEDGKVVSSSEFTHVVVPLLKAGQVDGHPVFGTDSSLISLWPGLVNIGEGGHFPAAGQIMIGAGWADRKAWKIGDEVLVTSPGDQLQTVRISGILPAQNNAFDLGLWVSMETAKAWRASVGLKHPIWQGDVVSYVLLKMESDHFPDLQSLINDRSVAQIIWVDTEKDKVARVASSATAIGISIAILIFALVGFTIFGLMSIRAETLRLSVATLRALGFQRSWIFSWWILESALAGLLAGVLGLLLQVFFFAILRSQVQDLWIFQSQDTSISWGLIFAGVFFSWAGSLMPFLKILGVSIHQELKSG